MTDKYHVYLLLDPLNRSNLWQERVFYVGKGTGARALNHDLDSGESRKTERISEIKKAGKNYEIMYASWTGSNSQEPTLMSERDAFRLEAALIEALRPQLTNEMSGHKLTFLSASSLDVLDHAALVDFPAYQNALVVCVMGLRGGVDFTGSFLSPDPESAWANARGWWDFGKRTQEQLTELLAKNTPVALIAITATRHSHPNIVNGVYQIAGHKLDKIPDGNRLKVLFDRKSADEESEAIKELRDLLEGNVLCLDGKPMVLRQRRIKKEVLEAAGFAAFSRKLGPGFPK